MPSPSTGTVRRISTPVTSLRYDGARAVELPDPGQPGTPETIRLRLKNGRNARVRMQFMDRSRAWFGASGVDRMGKPDFPTRDQIGQLQIASQMAPAKRRNLTQPIRLVPHELALVQWKP